MEHQAYTLADPRGGVRVYVGVTSDTLESRLRHHCWPSALKKGDKRSCWIRAMLRDGVRPVIEPLESYPDAETMYALEQYWIDQFRAWGFDLVNTQTGGKGWRGPRGPMSEAQKKSISSTLKGRKKPSRSAQHTVNNARAQGGTAIVDQNGRVYPTVGAACREHNLNRASVQRILKGTRRSIHGFTFKRTTER